MTDNTGKPLGIYIHIPFCKRKCKYCAFVSTPNFSLQRPYVSVLIDEILRSELVGSAVDTVYIGGGTPSCLYRGALGRIIAAVRDSFDVLPHAEITVECNPESVNNGFVDECKSGGVNRISMGLQSSCNDVLREIGRVHDHEMYIQAAELLSRSFSNISSDIILGLPNQSENDIDRSIKTIAEYCTHASIYALNVEDGTPLAENGYSVDDDKVADLYDRACGLLGKLGFERYEVSNFAKNGMYSRHNLKYWNCMPYLGFGVAAHGYDGERVRYCHGNDIENYIASSKVDSYELTDKDLYNEYVMLRLRTDKGIVLDEFYDRFGFSFVDKNKDVLSRLERDGVLIANNGAVAISPEYMFVMNEIILQLMLD